MKFRKIMYTVKIESAGFCVVKNHKIMSGLFFYIFMQYSNQQNSNE